MTESKETPPGPASAPDLILEALFQSRLRERSIYLGRIIQTQRRRLSDAADENVEKDELSVTRLRLAEQALAAVQEAEARLDGGRYGQCDNCGAPIGWDRLLESPEQSTCPACSRFGALEGGSRLTN